MFDSSHRGHPIDAAVEGSNGSDTRQLRRSTDVRIGEVEALTLVELDRTQQELRSEAATEGIGLSRGVAGEVPDKDVRIEEALSSTSSPRFLQVSARMRDHDAPRLAGGTGTLPASFKKSGTLARTARPLCTRNRTRSPALSWRDSRTDFGSVTCPFEVTVAERPSAPPYHRAWVRKQRARAHDPGPLVSCERQGVLEVFHDTPGRGRLARAIRSQPASGMIVEPSPARPARSASEVAVRTRFGPEHETEFHAARDERSWCPCGGGHPLRSAARELTDVRASSARS